MKLPVAVAAAVIAAAAVAVAAATTVVVVAVTVSVCLLPGAGVSRSVLKIIDLDGGCGAAALTDHS